MTLFRRTGRHRHRRRGAVAVLVAIAMVMIAGFAALTVDVGLLYNAAADTQRTVDSAALAGAGAIIGGDEAARTVATQFVSGNPIFKEILASDETVVEVGYWNGATLQFTTGAVSDAVAHNAVRVDGTHQQAVAFSRVFGHRDKTVNREAVALSGGGVCAGIWGLEGVTIDGNVTVDSFDSTDGSYGAGNRNANGDVCSCQDIVINGGINIFGDAMYGDGFSLTTFGSSYNIYGSVNDQSCNFTPFDPDFFNASVANDNGTIGLTSRGHDPFQGTQWDFYLTGPDVLTLNPGRYYFTSALMDGQSQLIINGPVEIFVDGPADFAGQGIVNSTQNPADLTIYVSGNTMHATGATGFYGGIHAPNATVFLDGGSEYFGTILAQTIDSDGEIVLHVDESLVKQMYDLDPSAPALVK